LKKNWSNHVCHRLWSRLLVYHRPPVVDLAHQALSLVEAGTTTLVVAVLGVNVNNA
jgi:hypothetical protein